MKKEILELQQRMTEAFDLRCDKDSAFARRAMTGKSVAAVEVVMKNVEEGI